MKEAGMRKTLLLAVGALWTATGAASATESLTVINVADNDTLSLRAAPDAKAAKVGTLPPHAADLAVVAVDPKGDWVKVRQGTVSGWAAAKFLGYPGGEPVKLTCSGSEPFWNMTVGYGAATFSYDGVTMKVPLEPRITVAGAMSPWLMAVHGKPGLFVLADSPDNKCQDDSGATANYSVVANIGKMFVAGCCN
jgi:Bacterial SH3 domain